MRRFSYQVVLRHEGRVVGCRAVGVAAVTEDALFREVLLGALSNDDPAVDVRVEPEWHDDGAPRVGALLVAAGAGEPARYAPAIFLEEVRELGRELLDGGVLTKDDEVRWSLEAFERPARSSRGAVRKTRAPFPLMSGGLRAGDPGTIRVAVGERALERFDAAIRADPLVEIAGLLTGRIVHDADRRAAELQVRDYRPLPAGGGGTSRIHFALDPTTFLAARRALAESAPGETCIGWAHVHPPCDACWTRADCDAHSIFFSTDDFRVHQAAFPAPFQVGLVAGKARELPASQIAFQAFGWSRGEIAALDFELERNPGASVRCATLRDGAAGPPAGALPAAPREAANDEHRRRYASETAGPPLRLVSDAK